MTVFLSSVSGDLGGYRRHLAHQLHVLPDEPVVVVMQEDVTQDDHLAKRFDKRTPTCVLAPDAPTPEAPPDLRSS